MNGEAAVKTILAAPFIAVIFGALATMMSLIYKTTRADVTGQWGRLMEFLFASWELSFGLINFASTLETLAAWVVLGMIVVGVLLSAIRRDF